VDDDIWEQKHSKLWTGPPTIFGTHPPVRYQIGGGVERGRWVLRRLVPCSNATLIDLAKKMSRCIGYQLQVTAAHIGHLSSWLSE
jgi:hypothetical protein